jgi:hypothetical protein
VSRQKCFKLQISAMQVTKIGQEDGTSALLTTNMASLLMQKPQGARPI